MEDPELALESFCSIFLEAVRTNTTTVKCRKHFKFTSNPWVTKGLLTSMRKKENLYRKTKKKPFNVRLAARYKSYCNVLNNLLKKSKQLYYENEFAKHKGNPKKQWELLKNFMNSPKNDVTCNSVNYKGKSISDASTIANSFSDYFYDIYNSRQTASAYPMTRCNRSFFLFPVTADEVCSVVLALKNTSAGLDNISVFHLKIVAPFVSEILSIIINRIFKSGVCPSTLKKPQIIPVFKKGDKSEVCNYRPISILSSISKIVEKLFCKRLNAYIKSSIC